MRNDSEPSQNRLDPVVEHTAGVMQEEWPLVSREDRLDLAREFPEAFAASGLSLDDPIQASSISEDETEE